MVRRTTRPKFGQPFLGSEPLVPVSQILVGCFLRWRLQDWSCYSYSNTNSLTHRRLLDWSWSQQNREKPKGQLTGDCSTGLGPNRNGENQQQLTGDCSTSFGHSTQREDNQPWHLTGDCSTVLGPNRNRENQQQLTGDCSTSLGHSTQREDNQPLTQHGRGAEGVIM